MIHKFIEPESGQEVCINDISLCTIHWGMIRDELIKACIVEPDIIFSCGNKEISVNFKDFYLSLRKEMLTTIRAFSEYETVKAIKEKLKGK